MAVCPKCGYMYGKTQKRSGVKGHQVDCKLLPKGQKHCPADCPAKYSDVCARLSQAFEIAETHKPAGSK